MGELKVKGFKESTDKVKYTARLLNDIEALEQMLDQGMFEKNPIRIGAEQEFCLVNEVWEPSNKSMEVLKTLNDPYFTTELCLYNLEANLDPQELTGGCFPKMHQQLDHLLKKARSVAEQHRLKVILTGILPTIDPRHLDTSYMAPIERYRILDKTIREVRGEDLELHIRGVDELNLRHDSILFEGCNTSFQVHLQIDPDDFMDSYNWAQAISGPILSICANSPLLMGRELWQETRIALFTQSVDTRASTFLLNERQSRVGFGSDWVQGSIVDFFKNNIINFRSLLTADFEFESTELLKDGKTPKLKALNLHNGTIYKWNRLCYGVTDGKPHVRIENRFMPSGPTTSDEIANMMFWVGVMHGRPKEFDNVHTKLNFKDIKSNFYNAARYGTAAQFYWNGNLLPCKELLLEYFIPMAYRGLYSMKVSPKDIEKYLSIIENRIRNQNGSRWMVNSYRNLRKEYERPDALRMLNAAMYDRERKGYNVDAWELARSNEFRSVMYEKTVRQRMRTKTVTAQENDSAELVLKMMQWKNINHVPIMDMHYNLVGLLTWTDVEKHIGHPDTSEKGIGSIMKTELITTTPETTLTEARHLMEKHKINCLPVIKGTKLQGIITSKDV